MPDRFTGLPKPVSGQLTCYFLGPGFGESIVLALPDGRWMVVDACYEAGKNLTFDLLSWLGVQQIDLLVLTHPDLDHLRGASSLIEHTIRLWPWPHHGSIRTLAAMASARQKGKKYQELHQLLVALASRIEQGLRVDPGSLGSPVWPAMADYKVCSLAPCSMDWHSSGAELNRLVEDGFKTHSKDALAVLEGVLTAGVLGDRPNRLSKAIGIYWGAHRILLSGDVECGTSPLSGWSGILKELEPWGSEPDRRDLLQDLSLIKLAHHGSSGAFHEEAWKLHCNGKLVEDAVLTPFNRGDVVAGNNPPKREVLVKLSTKARRIAATSPEGQAQARLLSAGWKRASTVRAAGTASVAALILGEKERQWIMAGKAELFMQPL